MRFGSEREHARHLAAGDRVGHPAEAGGSARHGAPAARAHAAHAGAEPVELQEVPPPLRLSRHRLALALSVTVAAVPLLVLDNLPANAEPDSRSVETAESAEAPVDDTAKSIVLLEPSTTTTVAPVTTVAPSTTEAPATTEAPPTTEAAIQAAQVMAAAPAPPPTAAPAPARPGDPNDPAWDKLAQCEAGGNWAANTGNGYYGGLQFSVGTWSNVGGTGYPHQASKAEQITRGKILQASSGWAAWPSCASKLGFI